MLAPPHLTARSTSSSGHLAADPELAIERVGRQIRDEPIGREESIPEPRREGLAIPVGADAVELLAHPPAARIVLDLPLVREEHRRRRLLLVRAAAFRRRRA